MDIQLATIFALTFLIHLVGTLAYAARIAGTRTGRIAISFALFNTLSLISRTSNTFQTPLLSKRIEENLQGGMTSGVEADFRWLLLSASLATLVGALLIPTFQRLFGKAVNAFSLYRSVPRLLLHAFSKAGIRHFRDSIRIPVKKNLTTFVQAAPIPKKIIAANVIAVAIWTVGVFSSLYAAYLNPDLRLTSGNLSAIVNGIATILMYVLIDPYLSVLTDDVIDGKMDDSAFHRVIIWLVGSRLVGTVIAQFFLVPAAVLVVRVAKII